MCRLSNPPDRDFSTRLPWMRFDAGEQNLAPTNGTCWYRSPSNLRLEGSSKSQAPNPKESPNPNTQIHQESVGVGIVGDSLRFGDRKSTRLNSSHSQISYAVFCLKKKKK